MVAQYADACNIFDMGPDGVKAKYDVARGRRPLMEHAPLNFHSLECGLQPDVFDSSLSSSSIVPVAEPLTD